MPQPKRSARAQAVPYHPLVEALASDPNQPPKQATQLFGYPGPAAEAKSTRLWLDLGLTSYVDVPDDAILHSRTLPDEEGTILWVDPAATLTHSVPAQQEVQAEFLAGSIAERHMERAKIPGIRPQRPTVVLTAYPTHADCPYSYLSCPTVWEGFCLPTPVTRGFFAEDAGAAGPLMTPPHQSIGIVCQSAVVRCPTEPPECVRFHSQVQLCVTQQQICTRAFICVASGGGGACPTGPWTGTTTPVIDQVGPFRAQF